MIPIHGLTIFLLYSKELTFSRTLPIGQIHGRTIGDQCASRLCIVLFLEHPIGLLSMEEQEDQCKSSLYIVLFPDTIHHGLENILDRS
jgi:hypothetical protein